MPFPPSPRTWLRLTFRWSNTPQTWKQRIADLVLIGGLVTAAAITMLVKLEWWQIILLWAACLAPSVPFGLMGWLKLFGPVLYYDMIRQARRSRFIILRLLYAILLVFLLAMVWLETTNVRPGRTETNQAAVIAQNYFEVFMVVQFVTVVLLTPAYVAGAISDEKDRKTLEFMLATDLLNREIVLSKLGSRLGNLGLVVLTGLPILSILQFLGGVDPNLILAGFAVTALTIAGQAGVSILFSAITKKPRDSIALAYLAVVGYYGLALLLWLVVSIPVWSIGSTPIWFGEVGPTLDDVSELINKGNLISFIVAVKMAGFRGTLAADLPGLVAGYAWFHGLLGVGCTAFAIARIRRAALAQTYEKAAKLPRKHRLGARTTVGAAPMLWKEVHCEHRTRSPWLVRIMILLLVAVTFGPALIIIWVHQDFNYTPRARNDNLVESMNIWLTICNVVVGCLTLLAVAVRAASSITAEREKQTFDTLLTTPIDSRPILFAKWIGSILSVRFGMIWLALIWAVGIVTGGMHMAALPGVIIAWLAFAAFAAALGLWFSTVCRTSLRAMVFTILCLIGLGVGHWIPTFCCISIANPRGPERWTEIIFKFQGGVLTPPFVMGWLPFSTVEFDRKQDRMSHREADLMGFCVAGIVTWAIGAGVLLAFTGARLRSLTHRQSLLTPDGMLWRRQRHPPPRSNVPVSSCVPPRAAAEGQEKRDDDDRRWESE